MSTVGNVNGGGGNLDFSYRSKVLKGLQSIFNGVSSLGVTNTLLGGLATEATLSQVESNTQPQGRTAGIIRPTTSGNINTVVAEFYSVSVANVGLNDGLILGEDIRPGEILNFAANGINNYFKSFDYDATGTDFVITFIY